MAKRSLEMATARTLSPFDNDLRRTDEVGWTSLSRFWHSILYRRTSDGVAAATHLFGAMAVEMNASESRMENRRFCCSSRVSELVPFEACRTWNRSVVWDCRSGDVGITPDDAKELRAMVHGMLGEDPLSFVPCQKARVEKRYLRFELRR
jgi:hypothetical protein